MTLNCIAIDDEQYALNQIGDLISFAPELSLIRGFENPFDALKYLHDEGSVDIIFCDIGMPFINGIEAGKLLKDYCNYLIYVTAHRNYGAEVSELNAYGYLLKPIRKITFMEKIENVIRSKSSELSAIDSGNITFIKGNLKNKYFGAKFEDITVITAELNYVKIHTLTGFHITYMPLSRVEMNISDRTEFRRINRSTIISMNHFDRVDGYTVYLKDKSEYTIGRSERSSFFDYLKRNLFNP
ncbi:MAG: response regulator transcription factor [Chryseobacterium sp.]|nr:MAG: response regulator transcription factor [Chryseobacterium sp.]